MTVPGHFGWSCRLSQRPMDLAVGVTAFSRLVRAAVDLDDELEATPRPNGVDPDETGATGAFRSRVRAQRHRRPLHDVRLRSKAGAVSKSPIAIHAVDYAARLERVGRSATSPTPGPSLWSERSKARHRQQVGRSSKPLLPPNRHGWPRRFEGTPLQSTAAGLTWRSPNSECFRPSASTADSRQTDTRRGNRRIGSKTAMPSTQANWQFTTQNARMKLQASLPNTLNHATSANSGNAQRQSIHVST